MGGGFHGGATTSMEAIPSSGGGGSSNRHSAAFTSSAVTSPTTPPKQQQQPGQRKPVGGIAVLPPMEMRRIEEQRKTPTPTGDGRQSQAGTQGGRPFSAASLKSPTSETTSEVLYTAVFELILNLEVRVCLTHYPFLIRLPLTTDFVFSPPHFCFRMFLRLFSLFLFRFYISSDFCMVRQCSCVCVIVCFDYLYHHHYYHHHHNHQLSSAPYTRQPGGGSYGSLKKKSDRDDFFSRDDHRRATTTTTTTTNGYTGGGKETDIDHPPTSSQQQQQQQSFMLRNSTKSPFVKEYTYLHSEESQPEGGAGGVGGQQQQQQQPSTRRGDPRDHGFSYMDDHRTGSPLRSPGMTTTTTTASSARSPTSPTSPSARPMTGFAFTYKPDGGGAAGQTPPKGAGSRASTLSPGSTTTSTKSPASAINRGGRETMIGGGGVGAGSPMGKTTTTTTSQYQHSKSSSLDKTTTTSRGGGAGAGSRPMTTSASDHYGLSSSSGRISRQSKDSKLEGSSSESLESSGGSSLDEYEKESYGLGGGGSSKPPRTASSKPKTTTTTTTTTSGYRQPIITSPAVSTKSSTTKSPPPPTKPKPASTSIFEYQHAPRSGGSTYQQMSAASTYHDPHGTSTGAGGYLGGPKITHASRKRVVTNADGSTIEMEEILEPATMTSHATTTKTSKPVVVGVLPSTTAGPTSYGSSTATYSRPDPVQNSTQTPLRSPLVDLINSFLCTLLSFSLLFFTLFPLLLLLLRSSFLLCTLSLISSSYLTLTLISFFSFFIDFLTLIFTFSLIFYLLRISIIFELDLIFYFLPFHRARFAASRALRAAAATRPTRCSPRRRTTTTVRTTTPTARLAAPDRRAAPRRRWWRPRRTRPRATMRPVLMAVDRPPTRSAPRCAT